jgi:hypothetical protein
MDDFKFPCNQKIEVLPADEENGIRTLNWVIREYNGCEVYRPGKDYPLLNKDDLKVGDKIDCWGSIAEVTGLTTAKSEHVIFMLEFDKDDRHCWVCNGVINMRGIERASKSTKIE